MVKRIISYLKFRWAKSNSERYCKFLRNKGVKVGIGTHINAKTCLIDITRPSLVTIGDNCYINDRLQKCEAEAFEYTRSIQERFGRRPQISDFWEEFRFFISGNEVENFPEIPVKRQLGPDYREHKAPYESFDDFLRAAGID